MERPSQPAKLSELSNKKGTKNKVTDTEEHNFPKSPKIEDEESSKETEVSMSKGEENSENFIKNTESDADQVKNPSKEETTTTTTAITNAADLNVIDKNELKLDFEKLANSQNEVFKAIFGIEGKVFKEFYKKYQNHSFLDDFSKEPMPTPTLKDSETKWLKALFYFQMKTKNISGKIIVSLLCGNKAKTEKPAQPEIKGADDRKKALGQLFSKSSKQPHEIIIGDVKRLRQLLKYGQKEFKEQSKKSKAKSKAKGEAPTEDSLSFTEVTLFKELKTDEYFDMHIEEYKKAWPTDTQNLSVTHAECQDLINKLSTQEGKGKGKKSEPVLNQKLANQITIAFGWENILKVAEPSEQNFVTVSSEAKKRDASKGAYLLSSANLDVFYPSRKTSAKNFFIHGNLLHGELAKEQFQKREALKLLGDIEPSCNVVVATMSFIISNAPLKKEGDKWKSTGFDIINIDIALPAEWQEKAVLGQSRLYCDRKDISEQYYKKAWDFLRAIYNRDYPIEDQKTESNNNAEPNLSTMNAQADYHSETIFYAYLLQDSTIHSLALKLQEEIAKKFGQGPANYRLYGIVIDINSTLNMCNNCGPLSYGFTNSEEQPSGFLFKLKKELDQLKFAKGNKDGKVRMLIRYSASSYTSNPPAKQYWEEDNAPNYLSQPPHDMKTLVETTSVLHKKKDQPKRQLTLFFSGTQTAADKERITEQLSLKAQTSVASAKPQL